MTDTIHTSSAVQSSSAVRVHHSQALADLDRRATGRLTTPTDEQWELATMPWVVNIPQHPIGVLDVHDVDDVIAAVRWAVDHGLQVTAQPTGHGANDTLEGALLLRTRALGGIEIDLERRTAWVGAGVKAGELNEALDGTGLTFLSGSNPDPTVVGMTITGGISWFSRAYGLGSDSIVGIELVDGLGRLRLLRADEDPELFWAVRGGGGDFGIITRLEVALHPAPQVYGGQLMWPVERMHDVLTTFHQVAGTAPEALTLWFHTWSFPPLPEIPEPIRGRSFTGIAATHLGSPEEAERLLAPFRAIDGLEVDAMRPVSIGELGAVAGEPTDPMPGMQRSQLLRDLDAETIAALVEAVGPDSGSPLPVVQIRHLGGAFTRTPEGAGSHGAVEEQYILFAIGVPAVPELVDVISAYFDRAAAAVAGQSTGRTLLNFLAPGEDPGLWWSSETRERLARAKQQSDPLRTIRSNRPVNGLTTEKEKTMEKQTINPWTWQEPLGFSQGVLVTEPRRTLYAAGQGPVDATGSLMHEGDIGAQTRYTMDNVETVLQAAGMTLADVVRYDIHTTSLLEYHIHGHAELVKRFAEAGVVPAGGIATEVPALSVPGMLVEVTVIACS